MFNSKLKERLKVARKAPNEVILEPGAIRALKIMAKERGKPYELLVRMLVHEGECELKPSRTIPEITKN
jgi:hypothetical protein